MTLLTRYILRQNIFLLFLVCGVGLGVYVFIELFDRLDEFLGANVGVQVIVGYFLCRIPFILGQIFPAVFLLALMLQLGFMLRNRELLALEACSVTPKAVATSIICYAVALCFVQLLFSEMLGVRGYQAAERIWIEEVRNREVAKRRLDDIWFREENRIVHMVEVLPVQRRGTKLTVYVLGEGGGDVTEVLQAESFTASEDGWALKNVTRTLTDSFAVQNASEMMIDLHTDVQSFLVIDPKTKLDSLPLWQLGTEINRLKDAGSNVERLQTAWHMKIAYAGSVVVMAVIALAVVSLFGSLFVIVPLGLVTTFCYYGLFVVCASAGEKGLIPPILAAWAANLIFSILAGGRIVFGRPFHLD